MGVKNHEKNCEDKRKNKFLSKNNAAKLKIGCSFNKVLQCASKGKTGCNKFSKNPCHQNTINQIQISNTKIIKMLNLQDISGKQLVND